MCPLCARHCSSDRNAKGNKHTNLVAPGAYEDNEMGAGKIGSALEEKDARGKASKTSKLRTKEAGGRNQEWTLEK